MLKTSPRAPVGGPGSTSTLPRVSRQRRFPRWAIVVVPLVVVVIAGYFGYTRFVAAQAPAAPPQTTPVRRGSVMSTVSSTGTVAPLTQAKLTSLASGRVVELDAKAGDTVAKDQVLGKLDTTDLMLALQQAKAGLSSAQAKLAAQKAGSRPEDVKASQAALDAAKAKLDLMLAGGRSEDVASSQAALDSAKAKLAQLTAPVKQADLDAAQQAVVAAQAGVQTAQTNLDNLIAGPSAADVKAAELAVDQAKNSLWGAQTSRDGTCGTSRVQKFQCDQANASVASAETGVIIAQNSLAKLKAPPTPQDLANDQQALVSAKSQLVAAESKLALVKTGSDPHDIEVARAAVTQAELALVLKAKPYTEADIQAQRQSVAQAEADLALKLNPYSATDILQTQAAIDQAQAQYDQAQNNLANATLVAPFDGVILSVGANVGEVLSSTSSIVLVNPKDIRLDVTVDENDVGRVQVGQRAEVTFDAVPGRPLAGKVSAIAPQATITSGVATYLVSIALGEPGQVRPGMTGNASIVYGEQANALVVPNRAVHTQGRTKTVDVLANGKKETRTVQVGVSNDQITEITQGVAEGEQVILGATAAAQPRIGGGPGGGFPGAIRD